MPRGRGGLTRPPPDLPSPRKPPTRKPGSPNAPPMTKPTKPKPKPPTTKPTKPKPNAPTKPSIVGNIGSGLATGGLLVGGSALFSGGLPGMGGGGASNFFGLAGQGIETAGTVAVADKAITAVKEVIEGITKNPMNLAIVAGAIGAVVFLGNKK